MCSHCSKLQKRHIRYADVALRLFGRGVGGDPASGIAVVFPSHDEETCG